MTLRQGLMQLAREARAEAVTNDEVAQLLGAPARSVYGWTRGARLPQRRRVPKLRAAVEGAPAPWLTPAARARILAAWDEAPPAEAANVVVVSARPRADGVLRITLEVRP